MRKCAVSSMHSFSDINYKENSVTNKKINVFGVELIQRVYIDQQ